MNIFAQVCCGVVAGTLLATAFLKILRIRSARLALLAWGLPSSSATVLILSFVELVAAALLICIPSVGAVVSGILLAVFTLGQLLALSKGAVSPCPCFGSTSESVVSMRSVVRNAFLIAACVVAQSASPSVLAFFVQVIVAIAIYQFIVMSERNRPKAKTD